MRDDSPEAIEAAIGELEELIEAERPQWKELWALVRAITDAFRTARFNTHEERQVGWNRFQGAVRRMKERSDAERERASGHLAEAASILDRLAEAVARGSKNVVQLLAAARTELRAARGAPKEQLDAAWDQFKSLESEWKREQAEAARELDERIEGLARLFDGARFGRGSWAEVWAEVRAIREEFKRVRYPSRDERADAWNGFQQLVDRMNADRDERRFRSERLAREIRNTAPNVADGGIVGGLASLGANMMTFGVLDGDAEEALKYQSDQLQDAWRLFGEQKDDLLTQDRREVYAELKQIEDVLKVAWTELKSSKQAAWRERKEANLAKNRDKLAELREKEAKMAEHAADLEDKIASAWNDEWRERAEGWLEELEEKLSSLREHIERVEGWIEEDEDALRR